MLIMLKVKPLRRDRRHVLRRIVFQIRIWLRNRVRWLGGFEPATLILLLILALAGWVFIELADSVVDGETHRFDPWLLRILRKSNDASTPIGPSWLHAMARDVTALGGYFCLILFTLMTVGYLWLDRKHHLSLFLLGSAVSGYIASTILKFFFQRPRPDVVPHLDYVISSSFPSGHSMNSAIIYLTLGTIIATSVARKRLKAYVMSVALFMTILIGISRVYLGVHYPTDVLAGWMAGLVWAILCFFVARRLQRRGTVEKPIRPPDEPSDSSELLPQPAAQSPDPHAS